MANAEGRIIAVTGATGRQGGAVARHLLRDGWQVRALTRQPEGDRARALAALGAEVVQGDMEAPASLAPLCAGVYGVYSVQTPYSGGPEAEVRQGKNVADAAKAAGVQHLVYGSAGTGQKGTGVPSWESKLAVEEHMRALGLPLTVLRPTAFMELMTDKQFFPAATTWHLMPKLMGPARKVLWLCTDDLGAIAATAFSRPDQFIGQDLNLVSDVQSINQCRDIYRAVMGKNPPRFPMPAWLFKRFGFVGQDLCAMWRWLETGTVDVDPALTFSIHPGARTVEAWLREQNSK
jgi:uncharacterized protein YbjT (DUF2867 family)